MRRQFIIFRVTQDVMRVLSASHTENLSDLADWLVNVSLKVYAASRLDLIHEVLAICPNEMPAINSNVCVKVAI